MKNVRKHICDELHPQPGVYYVNQDIFEKYRPATPKILWKVYFPIYRKIPIRRTL